MTKTRYNELLRFSGVGLSTTLLDFILLNLLASWFMLPVMVANIGSSSVGSLVNYLLNKEIVFEDRMHGRFESLLKYTAIIAVGILVFQNGILHLLNQTSMLDVGQWFDSLLGTISPGTQALALNLSKLVALFVASIWNYFMIRRFVFITSEDKRS